MTRDDSELQQAGAAEAYEEDLRRQRERDGSAPLAEPSEFGRREANVIRVLNSVFGGPRELDQTEAPPDIADSRFHVVRSLGTGAFGHVVLARDATLKRDVAIKVLHAHHALDPDISRRFLNEARTCANLDHRGIVPVFDWGDDDGLPYIVMAYAPHGHLGQWQDEQADPLPITTVAELVALVAEAVDYAHAQGIVHRDLKPANILLFPRQNAREGEFAFCPRVTDFGLAMSLEPCLEKYSGSSVLIGTPMYMAPEQAGRRRNEIGVCTDVYALGAILYHLLTGQPPHAGASYAELLNESRGEPPARPSQIRSDIDADLDTISLKCLQREPEDRYRSAHALAVDLRAWLSGKSISARRPTFSRRVYNWCRREQRISESAVVIVLLNVLLLAFAVVGTAMSIGLREIPLDSLEMGWTVGFLAFASAIIHGVNFWCAFQMFRGRLGPRLWMIATTFSIFWCILTFLNATGTIIMMPAYKATPGGRLFAMLSVSLLFAAQTSAYLVAGMAIRRHRWSAAPSR